MSFCTETPHFISSSPKNIEEFDYTKMSSDSQASTFGIEKTGVAALRDCLESLQQLDIVLLT